MTTCKRTINGMRPFFDPGQPLCGALGRVTPTGRRGSVCAYHYDEVCCQCGGPRGRRWPGENHPRPGVGGERVQKCTRCARLRADGTPRKAQTPRAYRHIEHLYRPVARALVLLCYDCGGRWGEPCPVHGEFSPATRQHVPSRGATARRGPHGEMFVTWAHSCCNNGEPETRMLLA